MIERVDRQDDTVMQQLIDSAASRYPYLLYSDTARLHPIENHWTTDWDVL